MNADDLTARLCQSMCDTAQVALVEPGLWRVHTAFSFPDGDGFSLYVRQLPSGGVRISDMGATLMHLSYDTDIAKLREGTRARLLGQVLAEHSVAEEDGEFQVELPLNQVGDGVFRLGQALTRIHDLSFLSRLRTENTFYEDLRNELERLTSAQALHADYLIPTLAQPDHYPIDFYIEGGSLPLYVFGVPSKDKAQLTTMILQHLLLNDLRFESLVVYQNMGELPRRAVSRLTNAANEQIDSLDAVVDLERKIAQRIS